MSDLLRGLSPADVIARDVVEASLEGGPAGLSAELRRGWVARSTSRVKIRYRSGHEHFERAATECSEDGPFVFRWADRTYLAE
jgi:hypothetical protein